LVGGDAAALFPAQAAAGFVSDPADLARVAAAVFALPGRFRQARRAIDSGTRVFHTTSAGRLFDAVAALCGFVTPVDYEGHAAIWLEQLANGSRLTDGYEMPVAHGVIDYRPMIGAVIGDRLAGRSSADIARAFHLGLAHALATAALQAARRSSTDSIVASGGVFQNALLVDSLEAELSGTGCVLWTNETVPANDGGLSLGQAALGVAEMRRRDA
jgi:hydrogenase maturation protein HypF